jgi:hypothetical protein
VEVAAQTLVEERRQMDFVKLKFCKVDFAFYFTWEVPTAETL